MYLRKSRQDDPHETVEEVLSKHETQLQEWARRELGHEISEKNIYREIVSGESIDERDEIKKVLARIEDPAVAGVLCKDASRLSRGELADCAKIIDSFRFTHTKIATLMMTFDLESKRDRKFFQDELLRGNDYLEYTKEVLYLGRVAAVKRGCYINATPPYGYNRIKIGRDWTLEPNADAENVRLIFHWYVNEGITAGACARRLNDLGIPSPRLEKWERWTILTILDNIHYIGKVRFSERGTVTVLEDGERIKKSQKRPAEEVIIAEGKQEAIIDQDIFERAQARRNDHPRIQYGVNLVNPLASVVRCKECGRVMLYREKTNSAPRLVCPKKPPCYKSAKIEEVIPALIRVLEESELPKLEEKIKNGDGDAINIQKKRLADLIKQMDEYREQEENQYELLETKKYTQDVFDRRNAALRVKMEKCAKQIFETKQSMPKDIDYVAKKVDLLAAIEALKNESMPIKERNDTLRKILDTVTYTATNGGLGVTNIRLKAKLKI